ncbi:MAG: 30S ribosomal protein S4 [Oscillospiraceae bacterium]|nr:30S ribosomal protein S4 [Oscillospiraceae bacterium]
MARYTGASCRQCRAEGQKLFLKSSRCYTGKCAVLRRSGLPGKNGQNRKKTSEYGLQLRAKQATRRYYGVLEKQFKHYYELAEKIKEGKAGENLLAILELRLDNVIYRIGWGGSRAQSRQLLLHGNFKVNGKKVNIPSYLTQAGDVISITEKSRNLESFKSIIEINRSRTYPKWLEFIDNENFEARIIQIPRREDIDLEVEETLIIELYSK